MKIILTLIRFIISIVIITLGVNNLSEPSNLQVSIGAAEILLGIAIVYKPIVTFFKKL